MVIVIIKRIVTKMIPMEIVRMSALIILDDADGDSNDDKAKVDCCDDDGSDNEDDSFSGKYFKFDFTEILTLWDGNLVFLNMVTISW